MKNFFNTVKDTFSSKEFYAKAKDGSAWNGFGFLMKAILAVSVVVGIVAIIAGLIALPRLRHYVADFTATNYPDGLVVTVKDGSLTTNTPDPVIVPFPANWAKDARPEEKMPSNLIVIAPAETADVAVLEKYDSLTVATGKAIVATGQGKGEVRVYSYKNMNTVITKQSLVETISKIEKFGTVALAIFAIPMAAFCIFFLFIGNLVWLFIVVLVAWGICKIAKVQLTYKQLYRQSVYALVPVLLLDVIAFPLGLSGRILTTAVIAAILIIVNRKFTIAIPEPVPVAE